METQELQTEPSAGRAWPQKQHIGCYLYSPASEGKTLTALTMDLNIFVTRTNLTLMNNGCPLTISQDDSQCHVTAAGFFLTQVPLHLSKALSHSTVFSLETSTPALKLLACSHLSLIHSLPDHVLFFQFTSHTHWFPFCLTPSEENVPHDPVSAFSCLTQPLKPGCLTLVLCSSHFLSLLQKISIFYLICPTSAQPAEVITRRTSRAPGCPGVMLRAALNLG